MKHRKKHETPAPQTAAAVLPEIVTAEPFFLSTRPRVVTALGILIVLLAMLRLVPTHDQKVEYKYDPAFNYRMTKTLVDTGSLPARDMLSMYPDGKDVKRLLPCAMYYVVGWGYRAMHAMFGVALDRAILYMTALFGSLVVIPIYLLGVRLYRQRWIAFMCAGLAGIIPGYLNRTAGYCYRFEVFGIWFNFMSLFFFAEAFSGRRERSLANAVVAGIFFVLALAFWRLSLVTLIAFLLVSAYALIRGVEPARCIKIAGSVLALYAASLVLFSGFGSTNPIGDYGSFPRALLQIVQSRLFGPVRFDDFTRIAVTIQELDTLSLKELFGYLYLSFTGILVVLYFFSRAMKRSGEIEHGIFSVALVFFLFLTMSFLRNKIFLGPLAALTAGEAILAARWQSVDIKRKAIYLVVLVALVRTAYDSGYLITTRGVNIHLSDDERGAFDAVSRLTPRGSPLLTYWSDGYHVQTYCGRPVVTDGLFEYPENIRRLLAESKALYSNDEDEYWRFCARYRVPYVLILKNRKRTYAGYAGMPYGAFFDQASDSPTLAGRATTLARLIYDPLSLRHFMRIFDNKTYALFLVKNI